MRGECTQRHLTAHTMLQRQQEYGSGLHCCPVRFIGCQLPTTAAGSYSSLVPSPRILPAPACHRPRPQTPQMSLDSLLTPPPRTRASADDYSSTLTAPITVRPLITTVPVAYRRGGRASAGRTGMVRRGCGCYRIQEDSACYGRRTNGSGIPDGEQWTDAVGCTDHQPYSESASEATGTGSRLTRSRPVVGDRLTGYCLRRIYVDELHSVAECIGIHQQQVHSSPD
jgi:hypothetical protein